MNRPLMQNGIAELERMFESSQANPKVLEALESELKFRSVPRATTLLNRVRRAINGAPIVPAATQDALFEQTVSNPQQAQLQIATGDLSGAAPTKGEPELLIHVSVEEACKILKVAQNASWDSIEQARRDVVELARPDRMEKLDEAKRRELHFNAVKANTALNTLLQDRKAR